jgi:hypothetical protein
MRDWLRFVFEGRPWWMNALMVFSAYMAFVYVPWDFFVKPMAHDHEAWLGILFTGFWAKLTEPLHWAIYAAGAYGFYRMRGWMWPWAAVYVASISIGMLVWSVCYGIGGLGGLLLGIVSALPFAWLARELWRAEGLFGARGPSLRERYGEWALVTGASAGIGVEFARQLAREGVSCALAARRGDRLEALATELEQTWRVQTRIVAGDLSKPGEAERVAEAVADLPIAILVNNAGVGAAGRFDRRETGQLRDMVELNCVAPVVLTSQLLPGMLARGRGAVVITGSIAGRQPLPLHGVYSATKAFDGFLGESLFVELRDEGIDVLVLEPGATDTEFQETAGEVPHPGASPAEVVEIALEALGRQPSVIPGWFDWLRANAASRLAPRPFVGFMARDVVAKQTPEALR